MGLLDWLEDTGIFGGSSASGAASPAPTAPSPMPPVQGYGNSPPIAPDPAGTMPPVQTFGDDDKPTYPPPSNPDIPRVVAPAPAPTPVPTPSPAPAPALKPVVPAAPPASPPGAPLNIAPPAQSAPSQPGFTSLHGMLAKALGMNPQQAQQLGASLSSGLQSVGQNWNKPGLAAFAGSAGSAMAGGQKQAAAQQQQAINYLNAAIKAKQNGDETAYKQNYLQYLLKVQTDKMASADDDSGSAANKMDSPTQLYLASERLVAADPEVRDAAAAVKAAREDGDPDEIAKAQANLQAVEASKQAQHWAALGLNPRTAAQIAQQPGNNRNNPIDGKSAGLTEDNIAQKLKPGQWFTNPKDGRLIQYNPTKQQAKKGAKQAVSGVPSTPSAPTKPGPINPMKPYQTPLSDDDD